jgi:hypothetical protein
LKLCGRLSQRHACELQGVPGVHLLVWEAVRCCAVFVIGRCLGLDSDGTYRQSKSLLLTRWERNSASRHGVGVSDVEGPGLAFEIAVAIASKKQSESDGLMR